MVEDVIEISKGKRLLVRFYEENGLIALIVQRKDLFENEWHTREHITLKREKAEKLLNILRKFLEA